MARRKPEPYVSYADYLAVEAESDLRWEWLDGQMWAMAGGTPAHSAIGTNIAGLLFLALRGRPCRPYNADLRLRVPASGLAFHADVAVMCGPPARDAEDPNAVTNPTVLVEVLSKSTERLDRFDKFLHYRKLPSFREYLLVSQTEARVQHFRKNDDGTWQLTEYTAGGVVPLASIDVALPVDEVYAGVPFAEAAADR
jgi:Uma2 family endonuclease